MNILVLVLLAHVKVIYFMSWLFSNSWELNWDTWCDQKSGILSQSYTLTAISWTSLMAQFPYFSICMFPKRWWHDNLDFAAEAAAAHVWLGLKNIYRSISMSSSRKISEISGGYRINRRKTTVAKVRWHILLANPTNSTSSGGATWIVNPWSK